MLGHIISLATGVWVCGHLWPHHGLRKSNDDAVDIAVAEGGATAGEMCVWWVVAVWEKMADGDEHAIFIHQQLWLFRVGKRWKKKLQCIWGRAEAEEEFAASEMCASLKAAMGMLAIDGDESAMVALYFDRVHDGSEHE